MKITEALFSGSSTRVSEKPKQKFPEFAFIGRSNVGKSSLINMLCRNKKLAMTSSKPGKTRLVNHFLINREWYLVDLPGYGYAKMSATAKQKLEQVIRNYLNFSEDMVMLFVLIDSRHDIGKVDMDFLVELGQGLTLLQHRSRRTRSRSSSCGRNSRLHSSVHLRQASAERRFLTTSNPSWRASKKTINTKPSYSYARRT